MTCKQCKWFDINHQRLSTFDIEKDMGFCRKHKPFLVKFKDLYFGMWPLVHEQDFCGEYREVK